MQRILCSLFKRTIGRLEAVHEFAPSYCVAAICLILMSISIVGCLWAFAAGMLLVAFGASVVAATLLGACVEVLSEVNLVRAYRDASESADG